MSRRRPRRCGREKAGNAAAVAVAAVDATDCARGIERRMRKKRLWVKKKEFRRAIENG